jgi:hypothetical protein
MVEQRPFKAFVEGSSPSQPTFSNLMKQAYMIILLFTLAAADALVVKTSDMIQLKYLFLLLFTAATGLGVKMAYEYRGK